MAFFETLNFLKRIAPMMKRIVFHKSIFLIAILGILLFPRPGLSMEGTEYQIKGAMMINFIKFVQWPESVLARTGNIITIGIIGRDNFGDALDPVNGRMIGENRVIIRRVRSLENMDEYNVLFVSKSETSRLGKIFRAVNGKPVLTIGEVEEFTQMGGIIRFYRQENHIRFEIDQQAAQKSGLKLSSRLLEIARVIR